MRQLKLGIPKGSLESVHHRAVRPSRLDHQPPQPQLFPHDQRSRDQLCAGALPGNGALRRQRHARRRPDRAWTGFWKLEADVAEIAS
jgi:hypothetical protein